MTEHRFTDTVTLTGARKTNDGYLVAEVRCARTGCQTYRGSELGVVDEATITVFRPESAVFNKDSMATFAGKPVTIGHPSERVTADNWKDHAVGDIGEDIARDGEFIRVPIKLMDAAAIQAVEDGTREISMGYTTPVNMEDGVAPDGTTYQAIQTGPIKINHLAIVDKARGGENLRIGDDANPWGLAPSTPRAVTKEDTMSDALKTVVLGDKAVQVSAADTITIEAFKTGQEKALTDAADAHKAQIDAKDAEIAKKDAEIQKLTDAQISDEEIDKRVTDRAVLVDKARLIVKDFKPEGLTDSDIRKKVVVAKLGDDAIADRSQAYIDARFDVLVEDADKVGDDPLKLALGDAKKTQDDLGKVYSDRRTSLADAWKGEPQKEEA